MTILAHLTDTHIVEPRFGARTQTSRARLQLISFGRRIDVHDRVARLKRGLLEARAGGADHVLLTGDLTEDGHDAQFEYLAEVLDESPFHPEEVTLVPGNHDGYLRLEAFDDALKGPLRKYRKTSLPGAVTVLDDVAIVAVPTVKRQRMARSAGEVSAEHVAHVKKVADSAAAAGIAAVVAMHHPPAGHSFAPLNWLDGMNDRRALPTLLQEHSHLHVLHGHLHRELDHGFHTKGQPQSFGANAVVDHDEPCRFYRVAEKRLHPIVQTAPTAEFATRLTAGPRMAFAG